MRSLVQIFLLSLFAIALASCGLSVNKSNVPGTYLNSSDENFDSIVIKEDGTFLHYYQEYSDKMTVDTSTWKYIYESYDSKIIVSRFRTNMVYYGFFQEPEDLDDFTEYSNRKMTLIETLGQITLGSGPDNMMHYYKRKPKPG